MYLFEGRDYSKDPSSEDEGRFRQLLEEQQGQLEGGGKGGRAPAAQCRGGSQASRGGGGFSGSRGLNQRQGAVILAHSNNYCC